MAEKIMSTLTNIYLNDEERSKLLSSLNICPSNEFVYFAKVEDSNSTYNVICYRHKSETILAKICGNDLEILCTRGKF